MTDVIQQAREVLAAWNDPDNDSINEIGVAIIESLAAVVEAADAGHLIDTRRIEALGECRLVHLPVSATPWTVWRVSRGLRGFRAASAAEALAAAEREAQ